MHEPIEIPFRNLGELEGATLGGRFRLDRLIGRGGYGAVFSGWQPSVDRPCAVKVLVPHVLDDPRNVRRFEAEARATSKLVHPHTVVIYDFGADESWGLLYLAMEFIDGESLRERIGHGRILHAHAAAQIVAQAAAALQDAHDHGLVHRDVKPHNIMLTTRGTHRDFVKVIDFGIAKFLDDDGIRRTFERLTRTGIIIGTPAYMSPEQVRSERLDGRSDQYSLAACAYHMVTGRTLFRGGGPVDIASRQLTHLPVPPRELNPALSVELDRVLLRALSKRREERFATVGEFAAALIDAAGPPPSPEELEPTQPVPRPLAAPVAASDASFEEPPTRPLDGIDAVRSADPPDRPDGVRALRVLGSREFREPARPLPRWWPLAVVPVVAAIGWGLVGERREEEAPPPPQVHPLAPSLGRAAPQAPPAAARVPVDDGVRTTAAPTGSAPLPEEDDDPAPARARPHAEPADRVSRAGADEAPGADVGHLTVVVVPWGTVVVDGAARGDRRRQTFELAAGSHVVELRQSGQVVARKTVDVHPGKNTMIELVASP